MKRAVLVLSAIILMVVGAQAQNRSIEFEESKVVSEIYDKAKEQNKLVFIDCYTDWCGPCKMLARDVFTLDEVADFFNENFINAKFEMQKDEEGIANVERWEVRAFPTLIFVDPESGDVVHRLVGAGNGEWLIEGGKIAMDPENNLSGLTSRFEKGERDFDFINQYLNALSTGYMDKQQNAVVSEYLSSMTLEQFATQENWEIFKTYQTDLLSEPSKSVISNVDLFYHNLGQQEINSHLEEFVLYNAAIMFSRPEGEQTQEASDLFNLINDSNLEFKPQAILFYESGDILRAEEWVKLVDKIEEASKQEVLGTYASGLYPYFFLMPLKDSGEPELIKRGADIADRFIENSEDNNMPKAMIYRVKKALFEALDDQESVEKAEEGYQKYIAKAREESKEQ